MQKNSLNKQTILLKLDISILIINITQQAEERFQNLKQEKTWRWQTFVDRIFYSIESHLKKEMIEEIIEAQEIKIQYLRDHPNNYQVVYFFQNLQSLLELFIYQQMFTWLITKSTLKNNRIKHFKKKKLLIMSIKQLLNQCTYIIMMLFIEIFNQIIFSQIFGQAKIADFSFCVYSPHFYRQILCGTIIDASPETLEGDMQVKKSDIWGFGYLIYELCFDIPSWKEHQQELIKTACVLIPSQTSKELREIIENLKDQLQKQAYNHSWLQQTQQILPQFIQQNVTIFN
ncbi:unnamed protein product [Paramecium primaurelia]|uniref:Protein kinase domain-containing protein n=1 Tax=Paramecium primaurelia TaxID=5886 RepID=A0A8S1P8S3_PARPR|nr:unnamed protein product [Paramecium primaurelia]